MNGLRIVVITVCFAAFASGALAAGRPGVAIARGGGFSRAGHGHTGFHGFRGRGFLVGDDFGGGDVIIQQSQTTIAAEPAKPVNKGRYVPPRWVDGGHGVEILQPGYWTGTEADNRR